MAQLRGIATTGDGAYANIQKWTLLSYERELRCRTEAIERVWGCRKHVGKQAAKEELHERPKPDIQSVDDKGIMLQFRYAFAKCYNQAQRKRTDSVSILSLTIP